VHEAPFYRPPEKSPEMQYLRERRKALGGAVPARNNAPVTMAVPTLADYAKTMDKLVSKGPGKEMSTTMGFVRLLGDLLRDKKIGKSIVPIVPDESRTFGMEGLFRQVGIYAHKGQLYEPVDSDQLAFYKEAKDGQLLEEGITEAGSMSSFIAAGTSYSSHGVPMIPMFIYYSMFGFQRIGDLIWAAMDARCKGFMLGGTAGRTTLNGEGLQHQDGHSLINAMAFPNVRAYDPAYAYETAVIIFDGLKRMYEDNETAIYYITLENENYLMPELPAGVEDGIIRGMYKLSSVEAKGGKKAGERVQLLGSGPILRESLRAADILAAKYNVSSDVWSVTSFNELRRDAQETERWNMLNPEKPRRHSYVEEQLGATKGPIIAASDYMRVLADQLTPWLGNRLFALGTDGMGRSESRENLRRHFEVDAESITIATLYKLMGEGKLDGQTVAAAIRDLGISPEKRSALYA
jgi:pyruvate dehydrogenase E1 component